MKGGVPPSQTREAGFTLIELLVSLTVLGLLAIALSGGIHFGTAAWNKVTNRADQAEQMRVAQFFLRQQLSQTYPHLVTASSEEPKVVFEGMRKKLHFLGPGFGDDAARGWSSITFIVEKDASGAYDVLTVVSKPELALSTDNSHERREVLLEKATQIELSFFGKSQGNTSVAWHSDWVGEGRLPEAIRVQISLPGGAQPDIYVMPRIGGDASCRFAPLTGDCQGR